MHKDMSTRTITRKEAIGLPSTGTGPGRLSPRTLPTPRQETPWTWSRTSSGCGCTGYLHVCVVLCRGTYKRYLECCDEIVHLRQGSKRVDPANIPLVLPALLFPGDHEHHIRALPEVSLIRSLGDDGLSVLTEHYHLHEALDLWTKEGARDRGGFYLGIQMPCAPQRLR